MRKSPPFTCVIVCKAHVLPLPQFPLARVNRAEPAYQSLRTGTFRNLPGSVPAGTESQTHASSVALSPTCVSTLPNTLYRLKSAGLTKYPSVWKNSPEPTQRRRSLEPAVQHGQIPGSAELPPFHVDDVILDLVIGNETHAPDVARSPNSALAKSLYIFPFPCTTSGISQCRSA